MKAIRVMVIDDSAVVRQVLKAVLGRDPAIEVIGVAADPLFALDKMARQWPDVIVLDLEMPRMDGLTFLRKVMAERPTPVVICSSLSEKGAQVTVQALAAGAVAVVTKPTVGLQAFLQAGAGELAATVKGAARARVKLARRVAAPPVAAPALAKTSDLVVAIGTSTGGTQALEVVLTALPVTCPGVVVVQHMPERFTAAFAQRLDSSCEVAVKEAASGDRVGPGRVLIAPGGRHMVLRRSGAQYHVDVIDGPPVNRHKPSVDVLFKSVAQQAGANAIGVIMTGMGDDGARGLLLMHEAGAATIAQDEATCVVYGMPKEAVRLGGVDRVLPLNAIPAAIVGKGG